METSIQKFLDDNSKIAIWTAAILLAATTGFVATTFGGAGADGGGVGAPLAMGASGGATEQAMDARGTNRKRVETIRLDFEAPDAEEAADVTGDRARSFGGYVQSSSFSRDHGDSSRIEVMVPSGNLSDFTESLESEGWKTESRDRNVRDVTERYTELELELENKRQELDRLQELMNQTNSTDSLIKIQERMGELRSRIQYLETQLEEIDRKVEYTEVTVSFEEPQPITAEFDVRESLADGYRGIFTSLQWIVVGAGYLLPFAVLYGIYRAARSRLSGKE